MTGHEREVQVKERGFGTTIYEGEVRVLDHLLKAAQRGAVVSSAVVRHSDFARLARKVFRMRKKFASGSNGTEAKP